MNSNPFILSIPRLFRLTKREITLAKLPFLYMSLAVLGSLTIGFFVSILNNEQYLSTFDTMSLMTSIGFLGIIWSSISFAELNQSSTRQQYLSLPASTFEKLLSKWLVISLLIPILYIVNFYIFGNLVSWIFNIFWTKDIPFPNISMTAFFPVGLLIFGLQSIFFAASAAMPKYTLLKVAATTFGVLVVLAIIGSLFMRIVFYEYFTGWELKIHGGNMHNSRFEWFTQPIPRYIGFLCLYLFFMTVAFFKLKEKEL